jgi:hypothetical protein
VSRCTAGQNRCSNDRHRWSAAKARGGGRDTQGGGNRIRVYSNPCCTVLTTATFGGVSPRGPSMALRFWVPRHKGSK